MNEMDMKAFILGGMFTLANRLQVLGDKVDQNITIKQWLLIAMISKSKQDPTISEIAAAVGYTRQNIKKMATLLEKQGFVNLSKDAKDARIIRVSLTQKCKDYFTKREDVEIAFMERLFQGFEEERLHGLYDGMLKLSDNIDEMEKENEKER